MVCKSQDGSRAHPLLLMAPHPVMAQRTSTLAAERPKFLTCGPETNQSDAVLSTKPQPLARGPEMTQSDTVLSTQTKAPVAVVKATATPSVQTGKYDAKIVLWERSLATSDVELREIADILPRHEMMSLLFNIEGVAATEAELATAATMPAVVLASTIHERLARALCTRAAALGKLRRFAESAQAATAAVRTATAARQSVLVALARYNRMVAASALGDAACVIADADVLLADGGEGAWLHDCDVATREATHAMRATVFARRGEFGRAMIDCARAGVRGTKIAAAIRARGGGKTPTPVVTTGAVEVAVTESHVVGSRKRSCCDSEGAAAAAAAAAAAEARPVSWRASTAAASGEPRAVVGSAAAAWVLPRTSRRRRRRSSPWDTWTATSPTRSFPSCR